MDGAFTLFETPVGACGIAWTARGIVALQLPEATPARTRARMLRGLPDACEAAAPEPVRAAIDAIVALLHGAAVDLGTIVLDESGVPEFQRRIYAITRSIAPGTTLSYGAIARRLGEPGAARAVGHALGCNPYAIIVPCHRVLAADGGIGGFSAGGGSATKRKLLAIERARVGDEPDLFAVEPALAAPAAGYRSA